MNATLHLVSATTLAQRAGTHSSVPLRLLAAGLLIADAMLERVDGDPLPLFRPERATDVLRNAPRAGRKPAAITHTQPVLATAAS